MKKIGVVLTLAVAFFYVTVSSVQADPLQAWHARHYMNNSLTAAPLPVWKITQDGTADCVTWVDANNPRFAVYDTNGDSTADEATWVDDVVLDKETGLVWERKPTTPSADWYNASVTAYNMYLGGRKGWRLPTVEELARLVNPDYASWPGGALPLGHPFRILSKGIYWSSTPYRDGGIPDGAWTLNFDDAHASRFEKDSVLDVWCVRGGQGHHGY